MWDKLWKSIEFDKLLEICLKYLMIENIMEKEKEIKEIWLEHRNQMIASLIYKKFLSPYFEIVPKVQDTPDWLFFLRWVSRWRNAERKEKKEEEKREMEIELENVTDEDIDEIQARNRRRVVLILGKLLDTYDKEPDVLKKAVRINEIMTTYKAIQSLEEKMKMTSIARGKLKLDAVKTILPYKRMNPDELITLREKLNESFDRILKLKSGEPVGRSGPDSG